MFKCIDDNFIYIQTPYDLRNFVTDELNGVYLKGKKAYRFPKNYHCMRELAKAFPELLSIPQFVEEGKRLNAIRNTMAAKRNQTDAPGDSRLRSYQRADVAYLKTLPSAGIFNEPRTGKTPTSIILMKELGTKRNLVIAPASLIWNWEKEIKTWWGDNMSLICVAQGNPKKRDSLYGAYKIHTQRGNTGVLIVSKDTWKTDYKYFKDYTFDTCFNDESHYLRNPKTAQSQAVYKIKAKRKYALTGTPTVKHPSDLWGILHFLYPEKFTSKYQFSDRYFYKWQNEYSGGFDYGTVRPERQNELQELTALISTDRKRKDVMQWLPDKQYQSIPVQMDGKQAKLYERMQEEFMAYLEDDADYIVDTPSVLSQLMRLRQLCLDPKLLGFETKSGKTDAILEWLDDNREPVVIMSMFTSYLKMLKPMIEKLNLKVGEINGEMSATEKQHAAEDFQAGRTDVLLCNAISAGTGFTLDRAEVTIFTDKPWNPADLEQCESRILPTTRERFHPVTIISFNCAGTVDERIDQILQDKKSLTDVINEGGKEAIRRLLG